MELSITDKVAVKRVLFTQLKRVNKDLISNRGKPRALWHQGAKEMLKNVATEFEINLNKLTGGVVNA